MTVGERELERLRALAEATEQVRPSDGFVDAVMAALSAGTAAEPDEQLARTSAATADLDVDPALGDSVMAALDPSDGALERAARATADLRPDEALTGAVMRAVAAAAGRTAWPHAVGRSARAVLVAASLAAAASVALSFYTQRELDADVMATVDSIEVAE
jgi:hypothetical protein